MRPIDHVDDAAEAIRALNHATFFQDDADSYEWPSDVDAVVGGLAVLAMRLPQALSQAAGWLERANAAGMVGHDQGLDAVGEAGTAVVLLRFAAARAEALSRDLAGIREVTAHLTGEEPASTPEPAPRPARRAAPRAGGLRVVRQRWVGGEQS